MASKFLPIVLASLILAIAPARAEPPPADLVGTYDGGQMEIGAGLELGADGRFEYGMSYGAVDEMASGTWAVDGDDIVLNSDPVTPPKFELLDSKPGGRGALDLTLDLPRGMQIQLFDAVVLFSDGTARRVEFEEARLRVKLEKGQVVSAVGLLFPIYMVASDKIDVPPGTGALHFRFEPNDLGTVAFDHQKLAREDGAFLLPRYDRVLRFRKVEEGDEQADDEQEEPTDELEGE